MNKTKTAVIISVAVFGLLGLAKNSWAASGCDGSGNCYVRSGASGTGTTWANAYSALPSSLSAGVTYWIAAGTYSAPNITSSGTSGSPIVIEAATTSNHGPDSTWSSSYAGQAVFSGVTGISGNYITFNGQSNGSQYPNQGTYNIKFWNKSNGSAYTVGVSGSGTYTGWTLSYVEIEGTNSSGNTDDGFTCYPTCNNININNSYLHETGANLVAMSYGGGSGSGHTYDHDYFYLNDRGDASGGHVQAMMETGSNVTITNSIIRDIRGSGFITQASGGSPATSNWNIVGNIFFWDSAFAANGGSWNGDGIIGDWNSPPSNSMAANNTIYGVSTSNTCNSYMWYDRPSDSKTYNNVWEQTANCNPTDSSSGSWDYNYYGKNSSNSNDSSSHKQTSSAETFANPTAYTIAGFALSSAAETAMNAGYTLSSPYNTDMLGVTRGTNGKWDRGALQTTGGSGGGDTTPPAAPTGLTVQ